MASWESRAAAKKRDGCECDDQCDVSDVGLFCSLACFIPWAKFIAIPGREFAEKCCVGDNSKRNFLDESTSGVDSPLNGGKHYLIPESKFQPAALNREKIIPLEDSPDVVRGAKSNISFRGKRTGILDF